VAHDFGVVKPDTTGAVSETVWAGNVADLGAGDLSLEVGGIRTDESMKIYDSPDSVEGAEVTPGEVDLRTSGRIEASGFVTDSTDSPWTKPISVELVNEDGSVVYDFGEISPDAGGKVSAETTHENITGITGNRAMLQIGGIKTDASIKIRSVDRVTDASLSPSQVDFSGTGAGNVVVSATVSDAAGNPWTDEVAAKLVRTDGGVEYDLGRLEPTETGDISKTVTADDLRGVSAGTVELEIADITTGASLRIVQAPETVAFASISPEEVDRGTNTDTEVRATVFDGAGDRWRNGVSVRLLRDSDGTVVYDLADVTPGDTGEISETVQLGNIETDSSGTVRLEVAGIRTDKTITLTDSSQKGAPDDPTADTSCTAQILGICLP
jgi:hypothetical protein